VFSARTEVGVDTCGYKRGVDSTSPPLSPTSPFVKLNFKIISERIMYQTFKILF
jgi:hypothetical protein